MNEQAIKQHLVVWKSPVFESLLQAIGSLTLTSFDHFDVLAVDVRCKIQCVEKWSGWKCRMKELEKYPGGWREL